MGIDRTIRRARRIALALHRRLGGWLAALFLMWFASGVVMLFVRYPSLPEADRLATMPVLSAERLALEPRDLPNLRDAETLVLTTVGDRPVYRLQPAADSPASPSGKLSAVYADSGAPVGPTSLALAAAEAKRLVRGKVLFEERLVSTDQWTVNGFADDLPLLRFASEDGTHVYVSEATGQAVQRTTASERFWSWLGPIPHWIYPAALRRHRGAWRWLVIFLSLLGALSCAAGLVGGTLLLRRSRKRALASPYRKRWHRWHHVLGLSFGVLAFFVDTEWSVLAHSLRLEPGKTSPSRHAPTRRRRLFGCDGVFNPRLPRHARLWRAARRARGRVP